MQLWEPQGKVLKERVISYIKSKIDEVGAIMIEWKDRDMLVWKKGEQYYARYMDVKPIHTKELKDGALESLLTIADAIHLLPAKQFTDENSSSTNETQVSS